MVRTMIREDIFALQYIILLTISSIVGSLQSPSRDPRISSTTFGSAPTWAAEIIVI